MHEVAATTGYCSMPMKARRHVPEAVLEMSAGVVSLGVLTSVTTSAGVATEEQDVLLRNPRTLHDTLTALQQQYASICTS